MSGENIPKGNERTELILMFEKETTWVRLNELYLFMSICMYALTHEYRLKKMESVPFMKSVSNTSLLFCSLLDFFLLFFLYTSSIMKALGRGSC